ncbi:Alpha-N-acetylgalactosamine-specific lectin [Holothuria leucospilota]|uniref:Alpha-N-acetylgalactosamine-specific lectin n=1 Tax=Holothuria leucospilota TaxID=206669 RepID=A0A9Q1C4L2_HOLLE|nr:Alpha-N-acetylgalactosamine-specific lectin [Holothuria leucospilota]
MEARQNCRSFGCGKFAYLASIHSQEEQDYLDALVKTYNDDTEGTNWHIWIGLHDEEDEGKFVWTDNSSVDFTSWAPGQPQGAALEQGVVMWYPTATDDGRWHDVSTTGSFKYICMMPCSL